MLYNNIIPFKTNTISPSYNETNIAYNNSNVNVTIKDYISTQPLNIFSHEYNYIIESIKNNTSLLFKERSGVDYSINSKTGKPFSGITQLTMQEIRNYNKFINQNFYPYNGENNCQIKINNLGYIIPNYDYKYNKTEYLTYWNHEQMLKHPLDYKPQIINTNTDYYLPDENTIQNILYKNIIKLYDSFYSGKAYIPSILLKENQNIILQQLSDEIISINKLANYAQNNLIIYNNIQYNDIIYTNKLYS